MTGVWIALCAGLGLALWRQSRKTKYWRDNATRQARKRLDGTDRQNRRQEFERQNMSRLYLLNCEVERLGDENRRLRNINRNLLKQMDRRIG